MNILMAHQPNNTKIIKDPINSSTTNNYISMKNTDLKMKKNQQKIETLINDILSDTKLSKNIINIIINHII
ncbi:hypothetical protein [Proteus vulgaris]|uniref:hypothetical protein n=1 Tax=Proteus vulgaris TaxID=585 RepID=UPI0011C036FC|nr:hypothetical protein [Proteus vulgaris]